MSTNASNLFAFDRALPAPFDTLKSKRLSVSSKYGDGTASTLCASVIKGIHAVFRCMGSTTARSPSTSPPWVPMPITWSSTTATPGH